VKPAAGRAGAGTVEGTGAEWRFPNAATPVGSSAYYSVRFSPRGLRDHLAALIAWRQQVRAVLERVSDPGVARLKLQWWREELQRTFDGEPRHPLSRQLCPALQSHALPPEPFLRVAGQVEEELLRRRPADAAALAEACERDQGALFELMARCHGQGATAQVGAARDLGTFCALVYLIRDSGALARRGRTVLPDEPLREHGLFAEALGERAHRARLPELLPGLAAQARDLLGRARARGSAPAVARVRSCILEALLQELEAMGFDVADQRVELTATRKLWLAWRESRAS
jgi:phytoene synthase